MTIFCIFVLFMKILCKILLVFLALIYAQIGPTKLSYWPVKLSSGLTKLLFRHAESSMYEVFIYANRSSDMRFILM